MAKPLRKSKARPSQPKAPAHGAEDAPDVSTSQSPAKVATSVPSALAASEKELVAGAYRKLMAGQQNSLTRSEKEAVRRHEKEKEERLRWQFYRSIPQKHWREMSGRQTKVLHEQAERYGIPFGGASIDLPAVVKALHDFLAENALKLAKEDDPLMVGSGSPALERYRTERALLAKLDRLERQRKVLPRESVRAAMGRVAAVLRGAGEALARQYGGGAVDILHEALDDAQREIERSFGKGAANQSEEDPQENPSDDQDPIEPTDGAEPNSTPAAPPPTGA